MKEPSIQNINIFKDQVELLLKFPLDAEYFQGHFPGLPILPGVAQVHFAALFAERYFDIKLKVQQIKKLRFARIIQPYEEVTLLLKYFELKNKVFFQFSCSKHLNSSGEFCLYEQE